MSDERENYCKLLGLNPFKIREYTEEDIAAQIRTTEERWTKEAESQSDRTKKYEFSEYLRMMPDIRSTMDSPILREEEFESAKKILQRKATKIRRSAIILHDGGVVIPSKAAEDLASKLNWPGVDGRTIIQASGVKTVPTPHGTAISLTTAFRMLQELGCYTPHEFLNRLISMPELSLTLNNVDENTPYDDVRLTFDTVYRRLSNIKTGKIPNLDIYLQNVRGVKSSLATDDKFDELMEYCRCMKALAGAFEQMEEDAGMPFSRAYIDNLMVTYVNDTDANPELCIRLLEEKCINRLYPANFSEKDSGLGTCPHCRSLINTGPDSQFCPECGAAINAVCPACGTAQTAANNLWIKCGVELAPAMARAKAFEDSIFRLLTAGMTQRAMDELSGLEGAFPLYDSIGTLKAKIRECHEKVSNLVETVSYDFSSLKYYDLKKTVEQGRIDFPSLMEREDVRTRYEEACKKVSEADELCVRAATRDGDEAVELYISASEICPDHPDAVEMLRHYPPEGPGDAEVQTNVDIIELRYAVPEERRGMTFCIYRSEGTYPEVDQSTKPLAEIEGWTYSDKTAVPGVEYFYKIYSKRWGILSEEFAKCGPALVLGEVTNVEFENTDDGFKITYLEPRGAARVRIWRKEAGLAAGTGDEDELFHDNNGTVYDTGLEGGMTYSYLFVAEYEVNGNTERSYGTVFSGTTAALPQPVKDLTIRWDRKHGTYIASWTGPLSATLYYSTMKREIPRGHMSAKELPGIMTRIDPLETEDGVFRFTLPQATVLYVYPVLTSGNTAVVGKEFVLANLHPFRNLTKTLEGNTCRLSMEWPDEAEAAAVEILRRKADGTEETEELEITRTDYDNDGFVEFQLGGSANTDVAVYAVYTIENEARRSIGLNTSIFSGESCKVDYVVSTSAVKGDRKKTRLEISFNCPGETVIPRCVMVLTDQGIPLRQRDGEVVWESDDPIILSNGRADCSFVMGKEEVDLSRMRLFFPDKRNYNKYRFVHPIYNRRK